MRRAGDAKFESKQPTMPYNILVPTDSSETAGKAFGYALNIASRSKATIYLYHVYSPVESPFIETVEIRRDYNMTNEELLMAELHRLRATRRQHIRT